MPAAVQGTGWLYEWMPLENAIVLVSCWYDQGSMKGSWKPEQGGGEGRR